MANKYLEERAKRAEIKKAIKFLESRPKREPFEFDKIVKENLTQIINQKNF